MSESESESESESRDAVSFPVVRGGVGDRCFRGTTVRQPPGDGAIESETGAASGRRRRAPRRRPPLRLACEERAEGPAGDAIPFPVSLGRFDLAGGERLPAQDSAEARTREARV